MELTPLREPDMEIIAELDRVLLPKPGDCVRVKYRKRGTRKWTRFVVIPDPDQDVQDLLRQAGDIAVLHEARLCAANAPGSTRKKKT